MYIPFIITMSIVASTCQQVGNLSYLVLSQGQNITIPLQQYFQDAHSTKIIEQKSSPNIRDFFHIYNTSERPYRQIYRRKMQFSYRGQTINLSDYKYYATKSLYNQPVKLFLLSNNFLMIHRYDQHSDNSSSQDNFVKGFNLTEKMNNVTFKKINCTGLEVSDAQSENSDYAYVICSSEQSGRKNFFIIEVTLVHTPLGIIYDASIKSSSYSYFLNKSSDCLEYNIKNFDQIKISTNSATNTTATFANILMIYCKNTKGPNTTIHYIKEIGQKPQNLGGNKVLHECMDNATYISVTENGFLSVINDKIFQYFINQTTNWPQCKSFVDLTNQTLLFGASRTYNNIEVTYFFLKSNSVIIKSSYRTNYQKIKIIYENFTSVTSYALTQHYMVLTLMRNELPNNKILYVYQMDDLYPRLIDKQVIPGTQSDGEYLLISTSNYLEKGFYFFFYKQNLSELSLVQYNGYLMTINPKSSYNNGGSKLQQKFISAVKSQRSKRNQIIQAFPQNSTIYTIYIEAQGLQTTSQKEFLTINVVIRQFEDSSLSFLPSKIMNIDSTIVNLNLSQIAIGPLQRYYIEIQIPANNTPVDIIQYYINYQSSINIQKIFNNSLNSKPKGVVAVEDVKQFAINVELKLTNPILTIFYKTFIRNCILKYRSQRFQFDVDCSASENIPFKSSFPGINSTKVIVLGKDKWLQYSPSNIEFCSIIGQSGLCQPFDVKQVNIKNDIERIKLVKFSSTLNSTCIDIFILTKNSLYYGMFYKDSTTNKIFNYSSHFVITQNQVSDLTIMELVNIHYDKYYNNFLLLHLSTTDGFIKHTANLYDHPKISNGKFIGHLIHKFDDNEIQSILSISNLLIIIYRYYDDTYKIKEYEITSSLSVYERRMYPLYNRKIVQGGNHTSDGQFVYIEVELERKQEGVTQYLVYCPSFSTSNLLTHSFRKYSTITFVQQIGISMSRYPHSIGINGDILFSISTPNIVMKFTETAKTQQNPKNISLKLIDYKNILHQFVTYYKINNSTDQTNSSVKNSPVNFSQGNKSADFIIQPNQINGPIMKVSLVFNNCRIVDVNETQFMDIFTKTQCLIDIGTKTYGTLLDITTINFGSHKSLEIIITTTSLICVDEGMIKNRLDLPVSTSCSIIDYEKNVGIFVCDEGQGSVINIFRLESEDCSRIYLQQQIPKPSWMIYQYFRMKFKNPYIVFEVPIRVETNKIYFLTQFYLETKNFSQNYFSLIRSSVTNYDNFETIDFDIDEVYAYLLVDGIGIYKLSTPNINSESNNTTKPVVWISLKDIQNIQRKYSTISQIVYLKPQKKNESDAFICEGNLNSHVILELGTVTNTFELLVCFEEGTQKYSITPLIVYKQYKDCKNNVLSQSKQYGDLIIKLCVLQIQEHDIFSNFMPLNAQSSEYYMQFYSHNHNSSSTNIQPIYPFRMQKITSNDTFQINQLRGELIIRSLFNFLCYYKLETKIKWSIKLNQSYNQNEQSCNGQLLTETRKNIGNITIKYERNKWSKQAVAWGHRTLFIFICLITLTKIRAERKQKEIKEHKMRFNLISNDFDMMVRFNSKKELDLQSNDSESILAQKDS